MDVGAIGIEFHRGINLGQCRRIFLLMLIDLRQPEMRIHQPRIAAQRLAIIFFRVLVVLHQPVNVAEFVVVQGEVGLDGSVFQKLIAGPREILLLQVGQPQIEVHERKLGIGVGGGLKFRQGGVVLLEIQIVFSDKEMVFR